MGAQLSNMELTKQQSNVMAALKQGNDALKKAQQEVRGRATEWWLGGWTQQQASVRVCIAAVDTQPDCNSALWCCTTQLQLSE